MAGSPTLQRVEWPNQNALRRYPLSVHASGMDRSGRLQLPSGFLVDFAISTPWEVNLHAAGFYVSRLTFSYESFRLEVSHRNSPAVVASAVGAFTESGNTTYALVGSGELAGTRGMLVIGDHKAITGEQPGSYQFSYTTAALDPNVVYSQPKSLRGLIVEDGGSETERITGDVRLRPSEGTRFRVEMAGEETIIVWDAIGTDDLRRNCDCDSSERPPVLTVAGLPPDETGAISLFGSRCLDVIPQTAGISLQNRCSEPCCDCQEDSGLEERLDLLYQQLMTMEDRVQALEANYLAVDDKISDDGGCDSVQCQPYDPFADGALIDSFKEVP